MIRSSVSFSEFVSPWSVCLKMALAWTQRVEGFPQLRRQRCVVADGLVVVLGFHVQEPYGLQSVLLDPRDCSWRYGPRMHGIRNKPFCAAAVRRDVFVLFFVRFPPSLGVLRMDTRTLQWKREEISGVIPFGAACIYSCVIDELLFLITRNYPNYSRGVDGEPRRGVYALDLTTGSWRSVTEEYPRFPVGRKCGMVGRCMYSLHQDSERHSVLRRWDIDTGECGSLEVDKKFNFSVKVCTALGYEDSILFLCLDAKDGTEFGGKWSSTALRYVVDGCQWTAPVHVYGEPPSRTDICCAAVAGDRAIVFMRPLFGRDTPAEVEVRVLDLAPGLRTLCLLAVRRHGLDVSDLPIALQRELQLLPAPPATSIPCSSASCP